MRAVLFWVILSTTSTTPSSASSVDEPADAAGVVKVHIPSALVADQFPADEPLRATTPTEFDALLRAVVAKDQERARGGPRLVRARHSARFSLDLLVGRSELTFSAERGPASISIEPWTPAILKGPETGAVAAATTDGAAIVRLEPRPETAESGETTVVLEWELRARPDSRGRIFHLALPGDETTTFALDVPRGWMPSGLAGRRLGPDPVEGRDREIWRFHGPAVGADLRLTNRTEVAPSPNLPRIWVDGPTRIDLRDPADSPEQPANWVMEWNLQADESAPDSIAVELDPGLELLEILGPSVREYRREADSRRVIVALDPNGAPYPSTLRFLAHAQVPVEGSWSIPAIRPVAPLTWTGGTTTVVLDEHHVLRECREHDGRRVPPPASEPPGTEAVLVFEAVAPGSPAELTFRPVGREPIYSLRSRMTVQEFTTRVDCEIGGVGVAGSAPEHELEFPAGWTVDRVEVVGVEEPIAWTQAPASDGSTRFRVLVPTSDVAPQGRVLIVGATSAPSLEAPRSLTLPRIRPTRGIVAEDAWVALAPAAIELAPTAATGLAWIDPTQAPGLLPAVVNGLRPALSWRWTSVDADATVDIRRVEPPPQGWTHVRARVEDQGRRLVISGWVAATTGRDSRPLRVWIDDEPADLDSWRFTDAATGATLTPKTLPESERRGRTFPENGVVLQLPLEPLDSGKVAVRFQATFPWNGRGRLPLVSLPASFSPRGVVQIETPEQMRSRIESEGLSRIEPAFANRLTPDPDSVGVVGTATPTVDAGWNVQAMTYSAPGARLDLTTESLTPIPTGGLIREARLTTQAFLEGRSLNRLWLLVAADQTESLVFRTPADSVLVAARLDGRPVEPTWAGESASIALGPLVSERTRSVELDYRIEPSKSPATRRLRPSVPEFGIPCLSFVWELALPAGAVLDVGENHGFVVDSAAPRPTWPFGVLRMARWRWPGEQTAVRSPREDVLQRLDESLGDAPGEDLTLAETFMRWDAGPVPLIVDRSSLATEGCGPRTRLAPPPGDEKTPSRSMAALQRLGLVLVMVDDALVATSRRAAASAAGPATWRSMTAEALLLGSDAGDRFQSAGRWRGEPTTADAQPGASGRLGRAPGWSNWRLSTTAWPEKDVSFGVVDGLTQTVLGWTAAAVVIAAGLRRRSTPRLGLLTPLVVMIAAVVFHGWTTALPPSITAGFFVGAFVQLLFRLGRLLRGTVRRTSSATRPERGGRRGFSTSRGVRIAAWLAAALGIAQASAFQEAGAPILAFLPYDGTFDPDAPPSRVVLRQSDYERLRMRAEPVKPEDDGPWILEAEHRVARNDDASLNVTSAYSLQSSSTNPMFEFPVGGARDIAATLDDDRIPVIVRPGGETAMVRLPQGRTSRLEIRRTVVTTDDGAMESLDLKINRCPSARLTLEHPANPSDGVRPVQQVSARGRVVAKGDRSIEAVLGPIERLEICWASSSPRPDTTSASVESLMLWDVDPAGERVRTRLTYRPRRRTSTIRIALDPGLTPRSVQIPGLVDASWGGTEENPEWIVRVDPPLLDRTTIFLDFWRPLQRAGAEPDGTDSSRDGSRAPMVRRLPRVVPLGVDREPGLVAVRRPGHWTGRLQSAMDAEPVGDEAFVRAWGGLPDDALTLAGTVRLGGQKPVEFRTGPAPVRWKRKTSAQVRVDAGRVDCVFEVELSEISGLLDHVELTVPEDMIVLDVESAGMTDWSRPVGGPIQARFDRLDLKTRRTIKIRGWIPVSEASVGAGGRRKRLPPPWVDARSKSELESSGTLEILSQGGVELVESTDGASTSSSVSVDASGTPSAEGSWSRQILRVDDSRKLGLIQWTIPPPRTNVFVASQVTIDPDSAEWVAVLRYEVAGGPLDSIHLKVPSAWSTSASLQLAGQDYQLTSESRDQSRYWTIVPKERPVWGSQRLVLRSRAAIAPGEELVFPEIAPLGRGVVDAALGLVFATTELPTTAGSAGLRQISYPSVFQDEAFVPATGLTARAYRVEREGWSLNVQALPRENAGSGTRDADARVDHAVLNLVTSDDGAVVGMAAYQTEARSGQFLTIAPPAGAQLIRAAVEGIAVTPLMDADARWTIPLGDQSAKSVTLTWTSPPVGTSRAIILPRVGDGRTPTLVSVGVPPGHALDPAASGLEIVGVERFQLERADRLSRRIFEEITEMDRASSRDLGRLASLLIDHESALRSAEHALLTASRSTDRARRERAGRDLDVIRTSNAQTIEALRATGLDEPIAVAWNYLGLEALDTDAGIETNSTVVPEQTDRDRLRRLGRPMFLVGVSPGLSDPPAQLTTEPDKASDYAGRVESRARSLLLLAFLVGLGMAGLTSARKLGAQSLIAAASLSLAAGAGGPLALLVSAVALLGGWLGTSPAPREAGAGG